MAYSSVLLDGYWPSASPPLTSDVVPTGYIWVVRDVEAANEGTTPDLATLYSNVENLWIVLTSASPGAQGETIQWKGRAVLTAGDTLGFQGQANSWLIHVSGYVLSTD